MQEIQHMPAELVGELHDKAGVRAQYMDARRALFDEISAEQAKMVSKAGPVERPDMGEIKSVGGVDYQITPKGWKKIGLTPVATGDNA